MNTQTFIDVLTGVREEELGDDRIDKGWCVVRDDDERDDVAVP